MKVYKLILLTSLIFVAVRFSSYAQCESNSNIPKELKNGSEKNANIPECTNCIRGEDGLMQITYTPDNTALNSKFKTPSCEKFGFPETPVGDFLTPFMGKVARAVLQSHFLSQPTRFQPINQRDLHFARIGEVALDSCLSNTGSEDDDYYSKYFFCLRESLYEDHYVIPGKQCLQELLDITSFLIKKNDYFTPIPIPNYHLRFMIIPLISSEGDLRIEDGSVAFINAKANSFRKTFNDWKHWIFFSFLDTRNNSSDLKELTKEVFNEKSLDNLKNEKSELERKESLTIKEKILKALYDLKINLRSATSSSFNNVYDSFKNELGKIFSDLNLKDLEEEFFNLPTTSLTPKDTVLENIFLKFLSRKLKNLRRQKTRDTETFHFDRNFSPEEIYFSEEDTYKMSRKDFESFL